MINRIFCYSDEEAKRNGNSVSIGKMILQVIGMVIVIMIVMFVCVQNSDDMESPILLLLILFGFLTWVIYFAIKFSLKFRSQLMGFATDTNNNVYCVTKLNNGEEFVIGGMAAGEIIDSVLKNSNSFAGNMAQGLGAAMTMYSLNNSAKIMQNPEIIAKMVECANTTTGAEVRQILKVYSYTKNSHSVKIRCDYKIMRTGKIVYNKNITIYKSFNCFNDLMNIILNNNGGNKDVL